MVSMSPEQTAVLAKEDLGPLTKSIIIAFTILSFLCVCLRLFTRLKYMGRAVGWEDYTIVISMVSQLLMVSLNSG